MRRWLACLCLVACSDDPKAAPPSTTGSSVLTAEDCKARCTAKASECQAPEKQADQLCAQLCKESITESQAQCIGLKTCGELIAAASNRGNLANVCPELDGGLAPNLDPPPFVPETMTILAAIPAGHVASHTRAEPLLSSLFVVTATPSFDPAPPPGHLPRVSDVEAEVVSPPRNGCEAKVNVTIAAAEIAVSTSGVDTLPATTCADFIDAIAKQGVTLSLRRVPWANTFERSNVTIVLVKR